MFESIPIELIYVMIPLLIFQIGLMLYGLYDWVKQGESLESRFVWLLVIVFVSIIGPIAYFLMAPRSETDF